MSAMRTAGMTLADRWVLERELARGGMGTVWLANDTRLHRRVAIKVMSPAHLQSEWGRARFEREALAIAQLHHPNVVRIHEYGVDGDRPFIVMELLEGEDLADRIERLGRLTVSALASVLDQAAKALTAAHGAGIIHRDIKPANLFLAREGDTEVVKILDFGVAGIVPSASDVRLTSTQSGFIVGSPQYMSPEQAVGDEVDHRSDLWSLALVAYVALTGRIPFEGTSFGRLVLQICAGPITPPSRLAPDLPPAIDAFFERALARAPEARFQSARALADAFAAIAEAERGARAAKILVVDDEPDVALLVKQRFRAQIRKGLYELVFAQSGDEALDRLRAHADFDVVLSDINMPGMDGLSFLARVAEIDPFVRVVIVSAYGDMANIRTAMNRGAFDFLVKPVDLDDLQATVEKTVRHVRSVRANVRCTRENALLKLFVGAGVVDRLLPCIRSGEAAPCEREDATVAVFDVHGFGAASAAVPADEAMRRLNAHFEAIAPEIGANGGVVARFDDDAVVAVFRGEGHEARALAASTAARDRVEALASEAANDAGGAPLLGLSIGIDSGEVVWGSVGSKGIGRVDYTAMGDVVRRAARLRSLAARGEILAGDALRRRVADAFELAPAGPRKAAPDDGDLAAFTVVSAVPPRAAGEPSAPAASGASSSVAATIAVSDPYRGP